MPDRVLEAYESVPYDSKPIHLSHVSRLEAIARLWGLNPASSDRCRVLELGCASGGNLIPMAVSLPASHFVGVDLAPSQVAAGQADIRALALDNIVLHAMNIAELSADFGEFDYIICHGTYSWVPPEVQDGILRVCSENLSPNGIAYVSYNTLPGWHLRNIGRDLLLHHDDPSLLAGERIARARVVIDRIASTVAQPKSVYEMVLAQELENLRQEPDGLILHEQLAPFNSPVRVEEFARRASTHGLRYLADAQLESNAQSAPPDGEGDAMRAQQSIDFAKGVTFRRTLLCHDSVIPFAKPGADALRGLYLAPRAAPTTVSEEDARRSEGTAEAFRSHDGVVMTTNNPLVIAALRVLLQVAPAALSFSELARRVEARVRIGITPGVASDTRDRIAGLEVVMLQCALGGMIELVSRALSVASVVSELPAASALARRRAEQGAAIPNLRHYPVAMTGLDRLILLHLDGSRTRGDLLAIATRAIAEAQPTGDGGVLNGTELAAAIDVTLQRFAATALLMA